VSFAVTTGSEPKLCCRVVIFVYIFF